MIHAGGETTSGDRPTVKPSDSKKGNGKEKGGGPLKVETLRNAVDGGKYRVESKKVAEKIVRKAVLELRVRLR